MRRGLARRRWWPIGLLLLVVCGVLLSTRPGWLHVLAESNAPQAAGSRAAASPAQGALTQTAALRPVPREVVAPPFPARAGSGATLPPSVESSVEVCGYGRVPKAEFDKDPGDPRPARLVAAEMAQALRTDQARAQLSARLAIGSDAERVVSRMMMGDIDGAVLVAKSSRDAQAYHLALAACGYGEQSAAPGSCHGIDALEWAQRDPEDARPWMTLASRALWKKDVTAAKTALEEALSRPKLSGAEPFIAVTMRNSAAVVTDRASLGLLAVEVMGRQAAMGVWNVAGPLNRYCSVEGLKDGQRQALCQQLSRKVLDAADTFLEAKVAQKIAERTGVPAEQQKYTAARLMAAWDGFGKDFVNLMGVDCATLARSADFFVQRAQQGELQLMLSLLDRNQQDKVAAAGASQVSR